MPSVSGGRGVSLVRLPLIRTVVQGDKVLLKIVGSALAPVGSADNLYLGPNGYVADPTQAQDFAAKISQDNIIVESPGAPGKSAYELWLMAGHEGTQNDYQNWLRGNPGQNASDEQIANKVQAYLTANPPAKGDTGSQGPQGNIGLTGQQGPKGDTGSTGSQGSAGTNGTNGATGSKGDTGLPGATLLGTLTITESSLISLGIGTSRAPLTFPAGWGVAAGQNLLVFATSLPAGVATHDVIVTSNIAGTVGITKPLLTIGAGAITLRVVRINV